MGMLEGDECCPRVCQARCQIRCLRDNLVHHWQRATFCLFGEKEAMEVFERDRIDYEARCR